jgi:hypothetical protein
VRERGGRREAFDSTDLQHLAAGGGMRRTNVRFFLTRPAAPIKRGFSFAQEARAANRAYESYLLGERAHRAKKRKREKSQRLFQRKEKRGVTARLSLLETVGFFLHRYLTSKPLSLEHAPFPSNALFLTHTRNQTLHDARSRDLRRRSQVHPRIPPRGAEGGSLCLALLSFFAGDDEGDPIDGGDECPGALPAPRPLRLLLCAAARLAARSQRKL